MAAKTWSNVSENVGYVLGVNSTEVIVLTITKDTSKGAMEKNEKRIASGDDPNKVGAETAVVIPYPRLRRIQVSELWQTLVFFYPNQKDESKESKATFKWKVGQFKKRKEMAREIASISKRSFEESSVNAGLLGVMFAPVIFGSIVAAFTYTMYSTAAELESGQQVEAQSLRNRGIERLLIWFSGLLGTRTSVIIGTVLLVIIIAWAIYMVFKRPQVIKLEFGRKQA